ncbi:hypothetical protein N5E37_14560 [Acinetobacter johnsonii]|uniref:hypothetical protein n=1 Tax=Acinetobacter johnsonii TaxID=40214 RepID=UPI00244B387D|nr:hypothetical protein [Acinetobacter johnsonii]MDH1727387.1 hypothetical protein [Acinetobacter johnsonii]
MEIQKQKNLYLAKLLEQEVIKQDEFEDLVFKPEINAFHSNYLSSRFMDNINLGWSAWQADKAQAVPEGFVLVPKENISCYWQDNDEPENFCSNESDFDCLGDCIDLGEIMEINKFTQAHVNKEILFGTWFAEAIDPSEKANFFVGTHAECLEIVAKNKAMIEAQEPAND